MLAAILNKKSIRVSLALRGIHIPQDTQFLAFEHNTTTDEKLIFEDNVLPLLHEKVLHLLQENLIKAKAKSAASRVNHFDVGGQVNPIEETGRRSQNWSEVRPEWGLARNAAFIIGPRKLTQALDLEGRCFLRK